MFSCEFCEIFKNTCFTENLWTAASEKWSCLLKNVYYNDGMNLKFIYQHRDGTIIGTIFKKVP